MKPSNWPILSLCFLGLLIFVNCQKAKQVKRTHPKRISSKRSIPTSRASVESPWKNVSIGKNLFGVSKPSKILKGKFNKPKLRGRGFGYGGSKKIPQTVFNKIVLRDGTKRKEIALALKRVWKDINTCYKNQMKINPTLVGIVYVGWEISTNGNPFNIVIDETTLKSPIVERCLILQLKRVRYPNIAKPKKAGFKFVFKNNKVE